MLDGGGGGEGDWSEPIFHRQQTTWSSSLILVSQKLSLNKAWSKYTFCAVKERDEEIEGGQVVISAHTGRDGADGSSA